jgi:hypothetical protein
MRKTAVPALQMLREVRHAVRFMGDAFPRFLYPRILV